MKKLFLLLLFMSGVFAKDYVLVVGVSQYKDKTLSRLDGVSKDIVVFQDIIKKRLVRDNEIVVLKDSKAKFKNIRNALIKITNKIKNGDRFFMYFGGHGTSLQDSRFSDALQKTEAHSRGYTIKSGILLPYDFDLKSLDSTILIGKRDLKKYFKIIDKKVSKALVLFDACFSGDGVRKNDDFIRIKIFNDKEKYPYKKLVYISSATYEAEDGAFTNVMRDCLNKKMTSGEVKECIENKKLNQSPTVFSDNGNLSVF